jgi:hypothetical protein
VSTASSATPIGRLLATSGCHSPGRRSGAAIDTTPASARNPSQNVITLNGITRARSPGFTPQLENMR